MRGGYRLPYDPRPALAKLREDGENREAWRELWNELHHQGDVGDASYVAVPMLVELRATGTPSLPNLYALVATIELERHRRANPPLPDWLASDYTGAWRGLLDFALSDIVASTDPQTVQSALAVAALAKGLLEVGALLWYHDPGTLVEFLNERLAWSELYATKAS
jgi:hypothetical protein